MNFLIIFEFIAALAVVTVSTHLTNRYTGDELHISDVAHDRRRRAVVPCPDEIVTTDQERFCANETEKTWEEADKYCKELGFRLAQPKHLLSLALKLVETQECATCWYWLGGKGSGIQQMWNNGSVVDPSPNVWMTDYPTNKTTDSDCLVLKSSNTSKQVLKTEKCSSNSGYAVCSTEFLDNTFQKEPQDVFVLSSENAEFHCESPRGIPIPAITWTLNDSTIEENSGLMTFENGTLVLKEVHPTNNGKYACHASNKVGNRSSSSANLYVAGPSAFEVLSEGSSCFALSPAERTWEDAKRWCKGHNAILAKPSKDLHLFHKRITKTQGATTFWEQGDKSNCTVFNSIKHPGMLSSENCSNLYDFICQLERCVIPRIHPPGLKGFSETSLTVSLPTNDDGNIIQYAYVVVFPRSIIINGTPKSKWNATSSAWDAEFIARQKFNKRKDVYWITAHLEYINGVLAKSNADPSSIDENNFVIGDNTKYGDFTNEPLEAGMQYYVVIVGETKLGDYTLYKSGEFGGPFHVTEYKPLNILHLLYVTGGTTLTLCLAMGIYTIVEKNRN